MKLFDMSAPIILLGAALATEVHTNVHTQTHNQLSAPVVTVLSGQSGLGVGGHAHFGGIGSLEAHYGLSRGYSEWTYSLLPKFGLSVADHFRELPQTLQFSMGLQALVSYQNYVLGMEYWHLSNGDMLGLAWSDKPNIGLDVLVVQAGYQF